jgi:hypothetical protein
MDFDTMLQHIDEFVDQNPRADHLDEAFDIIKQIMHTEIPKFSSIPKNQVDALQHNVGVLFYNASKLFAKAREADIASEITGCAEISEDLFDKLYAYRIACVEKALEYWDKSKNSFVADKAKVEACTRELNELYRHAQYIIPSDDSDAAVKGETDDSGTDNSDSSDSDV